MGPRHTLKFFFLKFILKELDSTEKKKNTGQIQNLFGQTYMGELLCRKREKKQNNYTTVTPTCISAHFTERETRRANALTAHLPEPNYKNHVGYTS